MRIHARALGQSSAANAAIYGDCQYAVPGITPDPGIPICSQSYEESQEQELAEQEALPPSGSAFGSDYASTQAAEIAAEVAANNAAANACTAQGGMIVAGVCQVPNPPASTVTPPKTTTSSGGSTPGATSTTTTTTTTSSTGCLQLFGASEPCWGPIGQYTALAGIAAVIVLWMLMKK